MGETVCTSLVCIERERRWRERRFASGGGRETLVCTQNTAVWHTRGVFNRSDRNFRATMHTYRSTKKDNRVIVHWWVIFFLMMLRVKKTAK